MFIITIILAFIDSQSWPELFFWLTMLSVVVINIANGVYQGCCYGAAAKLPMKYTNAVSIGVNLGGTIAALFLILSIAMSPSHRIEAIIYFSCTATLLAACLLAEYYLINNVRTYENFFRVNNKSFFIIFCRIFTSITMKKIENQKKIQKRLKVLINQLIILRVKK
jgi:equilibrative nucleoside transporter 1/2/3